MCSNHPCCWFAPFCVKALKFSHVLQFISLPLYFTEIGALFLKLKPSANHQPWETLHKILPFMIFWTSQIWTFTHILSARASLNYMTEYPIWTRWTECLRYFGACSLQVLALFSGLSCYRSYWGIIPGVILSTTMFQKQSNISLNANNLLGPAELS